MPPTRKNGSVSLAAKKQNHGNEVDEFRYTLNAFQVDSFPLKKEATDMVQVASPSVNRQERTCYYWCPQKPEALTRLSYQDCLMCSRLKRKKLKTLPMTCRYSWNFRGSTGRGSSRSNDRGSDGISACQAPAEPVSVVIPNNTESVQQPNNNRINLDSPALFWYFHRCSMVEYQETGTIST